MSSLDRRLRDVPVAPVLLALVVVGSVMAVGTVHVEVLLVVAALALLGTASVLWLSRRDVSALPGPSWVLLGLSAWSALQALPLPFRLLSTIAPHNADVWGRALRPLGEGPPVFAPISLDPGASLVEALKWTTYAAVFALAFVAGKRHGRYWGPVIVFFSAAAVAAVTLVHGIFGAKSLFGLYVPTAAVPRWGLPPLLNPNNLSGYLNLGVFAGVGMVLAHRRTQGNSPLPPRQVTGAGVTLIVAISLLAASRGGALGLAFGGILLVVLSRVLGRSRSSSIAPSGWRPTTLVMALAAGVLLAVLGAGEATWQELRDTSAAKIEILSWSKPLLQDHLWLGVGRGGFETAFPRYYQTGRHVLFTHAENFLVQWVAEWGLPVTLGAIAALVWHLRPTRVGFRGDAVALGVGVGVAVVLVQNLADLALEVPAVVITLAASIGSLWRAPPKESAANPVSRRRRTWPMWVIASSGAATWGLAAARGLHPAGTDRRDLGHVYSATHFGSLEVLAQFHSHLRGAMARHPGDPYLPLLGAMAARRTPGANAMPWVAATLERDEGNARAHLVLAEILAVRGARNQALMELRVAVERERELVAWAARVAMAWPGAVTDLERAAPDGSLGAEFFHAAAKFTPEDQVQKRSGLLDAALRRDASFVPALTLKAYDLSNAVDRGLEPCKSAPDPCLRVAGELAGKIERADPSSCDPAVLRARDLVRREKAAEAERLLAQRCPTCRPALECLQARVLAASAAKPPTALGMAIRAYTGTACSETKACAAAHLVVGDVLAGRAEWAPAAEHYTTSARQQPHPAVWLKVADSAAKAGQSTRALGALTKAEREAAGDPAMLQKVEETRSRLLSQTTLSP